MYRNSGNKDNLTAKQSQIRATAEPGTDTTVAEELRVEKPSVNCVFVGFTMKVLLFKEGGVRC